MVFPFFLWFSNVFYSSFYVFSMFFQKFFLWFLWFSYVFRCFVSWFPMVLFLFLARLKALCLRDCIANYVKQNTTVDNTKVDKHMAPNKSKNKR